jgi:prolyl oligopeptidase
MPKAHPLIIGLLAHFFLLGFLTNSSQLVANGQSHRLNYPPARRVNQVDNYHGVEVPDPYRWMEEMKSEETLAWVKAQDDLLKGLLDSVPARATLQKRIMELVNHDIYTTPIKANGRYFFTKRNAGKGLGEGVLYVQTSLNAAPRILLDPATRFKDGRQLGVFRPSPDGRYLAYGVVTRQSRWWDLRVMNTTTGKDLSDALTGLHNVLGTVSWTRDSKGFFYSRFEPPKPGEEQQAVLKNPKIYFHELGKPQSEDTFVTDLPDKPNWVFTHNITDDGRYLIISASEGGANQNQILYRDLHGTGATIKTLIGEADADYKFLGNEGTRFWFYTDLNAPRGRVIAIDLNQPQRDRWVEVIPEAKESISARDQTGGNALGMHGNRFVLVYIKEGKPLIRIFSARGRLEREVRIAEGGSIWAGFVGTQKDPEVFYLFLGLADPSTIYRLNVATGAQTVFARSKLDFNRDNYVVKQVFYESKDGTRVPMFITHKKGLTLDGTNPTWIYSYGAMGWISFLWYRPDRLAWLERGGVYALPGIRGGGEYGEEWHQAGMKMKEQNSIDDYLAAADWLIKNKYTSPQKLVANGGSLSAALAGAAIEQRPDLFGAAIIDIPVVDLLRFEKFTGGSYWLPELGSPANADEFKALYDYSPYHNVKSGQCYPPTLIMVGERDQTAVPLHAYKFTAAMQSAQECDNPVLMKMMRGAAHNFGLTLEQQTDSYTDELSFLFHVLKISHEVTKPDTAKSY